jgi:hypothetical protein
MSGGKTDPSKFLNSYASRVIANEVKQFLTFYPDTSDFFHLILTKNETGQELFNSFKTGKFLDNP